MSNNKSSDSPPLSSKEAEGAAAASASAAPVQISDESNHDESIVEKEEVVTTTTMEDPPTISPMDPPSPSYSGLQLPPHPARNTDDDDDGGVSLEAWSEWDSIADNASKSSSSTRCATTKAALSSNNTAGVASSQGKSAETTRTIIYEDEGDLPSLSGRRNCEPPDANATTTTHPQHQHRLRNVTPNDPPEYGYRKKVHHAAASTGIHNIQMNSRGHVYLDGEESVANSSNGPPGNLAKAINNHNHSHEDDNETTTSTRYSINSNTSSTNSPPPPSDYFNQPSHRQIYPAEPRGGAVDIVSGNYDESSFVGSSEATSIASNTTRSTTTTFHSGSRGGGGGSNGEYFDGNVNSALDRHLSKGGGSAGRTDNSNSNSRRMRDPQDFTETIKKQDPQVLNESDNATGGYGNNTYSGRQASRLVDNFDAAERQEMEPFIGRQQQRVVYASSAKRDLHNHYRNAYPDKAKDSDLESGRASSHQQHTQRVRFADKMFSSRESTFSSTSSSHQVVVGNATSSSSSHSAYGLSWRDRSVCSENSATSKSSIDSQSSNSSMSNRVRGSSNGSSRSGGVGREVVSLLANGLKNIFEGLHSTASAPSSNSSTSSNSSSSGGGGARNYNSARFNYLKRYTALLATLSMMMLVTIGSYSGAFFGASANDNNDNNADSPRGLGIEHDMRPPAMGLMDNVPHQAMLKGSVGAGVNNNGGGNNIMGGSGGGGLPPLVENGQVVDWDKVPPHLRGYYSKVFGVQGGGNANQQQQQQQQAEMQYTQQKQVQEEDPNAAAQAIQSIGNEAIGAENSFKVPTLEQHEFQQHIQELEGAVPFLGQQQQEQMQQQQQMQQQREQHEQQMQQQDEQEVKEELAKQQLEQVHQRQQAEAEQQRAQAEQKQRAQAEADQLQQQQQEALQRAQAEQQQQQQQQQQEQQPKEMSLPSPEEINAAREENAKRIAREEEMRRKQAEEEALRMAGNAEEKMKQQRDDSEAAAAQNGEANKMNEASTNAVDQVNSGAENGAPLPEPVVAAAAEVGGQNNAEDENATLESLQSELSELMDMMKQRGGDKG